MTAGTGVVPRASFRVPLADGRALDLGERTLVMGVLNVTPDSFADRVPFGSVADAIEAALAMERDGADLIDVGGESTRPGAEPVPEVEELARVVPVVRALVRRLRVPVSVDTYKAEVARAVLGEGASIVNDISGLGYDPTLGAVVASAGAAIVLMHTRGRSREMYREATYGEVARDVAAELAESLRTAVSAGIGLDSGHRRSRIRVRQTGRAQLRVAGAARRAGGARSADSGRSVAQVVPGGGKRRPAACCPRLGHGGGRHGGGARRRPRRARSRRRGDGPGGSRGRPDSGGSGGPATASRSHEDDGG